MRTATVLYVGDLALMRAFYQECFELTEADAGPGYVGLTSDGWLLTLVQTPSAVTGSTPPRRRSEQAIKLAFAVDDIAGLRPIVARRQGSVEPVDAEWVFRGAVHCDCVDPEGNVVQLIQAGRT